MFSSEDALWQISGLQDEPVELSASDWLSALGQALRAEGRLSALGGLACEQLSEGAVIVHDMQHGARYVLQRQGAPAALALPAGAPIPLGDAPGAPEPTGDGLAAFELDEPAPPPLALVSDEVSVYDASAFDMDELYLHALDPDDPSEEVTVMIQRGVLGA